MASFEPQNAPNNLTMADFYSAVNNLGGPAKQCRFAVRVLPVGTDNIINSLGYSGFMRDMVMICESADLPGRGFDFMEARYYGPSFNLPRNSKYATADLTFICRTESFERQLFDDWLEIINPSNIWDFNYPKQYYSMIQIFQFAEYGQGSSLSPDQMAMPRAQDNPMVPVYQWNLYQAWPVEVRPQPVTWADVDILKLTVTFSYRYWSRPGRDTDPTSGEITLTKNF